MINSAVIESLKRTRRKPPMLPPFVHDTLKWLRSETVLPFGSAQPVDDEADASNPGAGAYAAPLAAAFGGLFAAGALLLAWSLRLPPFAVAALTILTLAAVRGGRFESGTVRGGDALAGQPGAGTAALALLLLVQAAALEGLIAHHAPHAALVIIVAAIFGSTASIVFRLTQPARPIEELGDDTRVSQSAALQGLSVVTIVIGTAILLPFLRIGATAAAFVGAIVAFVTVVAIAKNQDKGHVPDCACAAGKTTETLTLLAVLVILRA